MSGVREELFALIDKLRDDMASGRMPKQIQRELIGPLARLYEAASVCSEEDVMEMLTYIKTKRHTRH